MKDVNGVKINWRRYDHRCSPLRGIPYPPYSTWRCPECKKRWEMSCGSWKDPGWPSLRWRYRTGKNYQKSPRSGSGK